MTLLEAFAFARQDGGGESYGGNHPISATILTSRSSHPSAGGLLDGHPQAPHLRRSFVVRGGISETTVAPSAWLAHRCVLRMILFFSANGIETLTCIYIWRETCRSYLQDAFFFGSHRLKEFFWQCVSPRLFGSPEPPQATTELGMWMFAGPLPLGGCIFGPSFRRCNNSFALRVQPINIFCCEFDVLIAPRSSFCIASIFFIT